MLTEAQAWKLLDGVPDPEVPAVSVVELGIIRELHCVDGVITVVVTPTYSGCPATEVIGLAIRDTLLEAGARKVELQTRLDPAWTSDWIGEAAREKLRAYGIAPPSRVCGSAAAQPQVMQFIRDAAVVDAVDCPHCGSAQTVEASHFGSTPCKALYKCLSCQEPFDYFKPF